MCNFPESLIAQSINDLEAEEGKIVVPEKEEEESTGLKLKRRMSSILKGQKPSSVVRRRKEKNPVHLEAAANEPLLEEEKRVSWTLMSPRDSKLISSDEKAQRLHNLKIRRQSITYRKACLSTPKYQIKASSCPDIYKNTMVDDAFEKEGVTAELTGLLNKCCSLEYIKIPFLIFCFSNFHLYFW